MVCSIRAGSPEVAVAIAESVTGMDQGIAEAALRKRGVLVEGSG